MRRRRDEALERWTEEVFSRLVKPTQVYTSYHIPLANGGYAERDLLLIADGELFIVEAKARPLRHPGQTGGNVVKILGDIKAGIEQGYKQCCTVEQYISQGGPVVNLYDKNGNIVARIDKASIGRVHKTVVVWQRYEMAASDLPTWLTLEAGDTWPWVVDICTADTITLKEWGAKRLGDFMRWRSSLQGYVHNQDEAVFAGCFLAHGAVEFPRGMSMAQLGDEYGDIFEVEYFRAHGHDVPDVKANRKPVFSTIQRVGSKVKFAIDGRRYDEVELRGPEKAPKNRAAVTNRFKTRKRRSR